MINEYPMNITRGRQWKTRWKIDSVCPMRRRNTKFELILQTLPKNSRIEFLKFNPIRIFHRI